MPELPEVETTLRGIQLHIERQTITAICVRHHTLRWPIPPELHKILKDQEVTGLSRRGKYLLLHTAIGTLILHLGMSGSLRILNQATPAKKHDHVDIEFSNQKVLRFTDPRRFGAVLWTQDDPLLHPLLQHLGVEPLSKGFTGKYLWERSRHRKVAIKSFIMDSKVVVGVGNIYAAEALFAAGVYPLKNAGEMSLKACDGLVVEIKKILRAAIKQGGTTLKDFTNSDGKPGYFKFSLQVYGRGGLGCVRCGEELVEIRLGQRGTVFCEGCQR